MAVEFISKFEGRLWTQGKDGLLYPSIDIASMNASGALLCNAMERSLQLVSQMKISISRLKRDPSISIDGLNCKVGPISSIERPDGARLEAGSSVTAQTPNYQSSDCLSKDENAVDLASDPIGRTAPRAGGHQVIFGPQQSDEDLRSSGEVVALAYTNTIGRLTNRKTISEWIRRISLAADEGSVSILSMLSPFAR